VSPSRQKTKLLSGLFAILLMAAEWILLVAGAPCHEMIVGVVVVTVSSFFLTNVNQMSTLDLDFRVSDVAKGWRVPWDVIRDCYTITAVLVRDLFTSRNSGSFYRVCVFKTSEYDPRLIARRVLATLYTTTSPNSIVIGIDFNQNRMLFHQLQRSTFPKAAKSLGANP
jgi:multisubunit Na+/H+ antiporter MnhE subunit